MLKILAGVVVLGLIGGAHAAYEPEKDTEFIRVAKNAACRGVPDYQQQACSKCGDVYGPGLSRCTWQCAREWSYHQDVAQKNSCYLACNYTYASALARCTIDTWRASLR